MANLNLSEFTEKLFVADTDHTFIWDTAALISKRVSRNSWLSGTTADFHLGLADAATAVAQTISVQSVVAGTTNTAGANLSINGSQGTGTGAGGSLLLRTAPAGISGTAQNALVTAVAITSAGNVGIGTTAPGAKLQVGTHSGAIPSGSVVAIAGAVPRLSFSSNDDSLNYGGYILSNYAAGTFMTLGTRDSNADTAALTLKGGNVGIGTTSPTSKLHVAGSSSPSITVDNTVNTGASQLLFKNTVVTGDTDGIFLNGSTQTGFGGAGSLNIKATTGPLAFHTASVTNAFSMAQTGAATFSQGVTFNNDIYGQRDVYSGNGRYFRFANATALSSSAVGLMLLSDLTGVNLSPRIAFGGVDATFPALKRSGTSASFDVVLANDSGFTSIQDLYRRFGAGTPEGVVTAPIGAVYHNTTGGAGTSFYVKESGTGNTGWVGK